MLNREYLRLNVFDKNTLQFKDKSTISSDNYVIDVDIYVEKISSFTLTPKTTINGVSLNASAGDIVYITNENNVLLYIGTINDIELSETETTNLITIKTTDIFDLLNVDIVAISLIAGNVADYIESIIEDNFVLTADPKLQKDYLNIVKNVSTVGTLLFDEDTSIRFYDLMNIVFDTFNIYIKFSIEYSSSGIPESLRVELTDEQKQITLKDNVKDIQDIKIKELNKQTVNKVTLEPKAENVVDLVTVDYYLLIDNTITTDETDVNRFDDVISKIIFYADGDDLAALASKELKGNIYNHYIDFNYLTDSKIYTPIEEFNVYDRFNLILQDKSYDSILTGYTINSNNNVIKLVYGKVRITLTDKLNRRGNL